MTLNRYLRYFVIGGLFLIPLVPLLVFTSQYFPFVTSKNFAFRIIVELIFGAWLILALRDANYRPKFSWLSGAVLIFLVAIGVADLFGPFPDKSFWSNFRRMEGYITILHLGAYFLVAASTLISENLWILFMQTALGSSVVMGIYAVPQLLEKFAVNQGEFRLTGRLGNAAFLAVYALLHLFIALFLLVRRRNLRRWNIIYGLIASLELVILYHTATRSTMLGLFIGLFIAGLSVALLTKGFNGLKKTAIGVMAALILAVVGWALLKDSSFVKQNPTLARLTSLSLAEVGPRKIVWDIAIKGFEERPIFGWGQENFNHVFNKYFDPATDPADQWYVENRWSDRAHNIFLDWLIAGGLVGLLSYLFIFLSALYYIWQQNECGLSCNALIKRLCTFWKPGATFHCLPEKSILTGMLGAYLFQNVFMFDNLASYIIFFTILAYIHSMSGRPIKALTEEKITISAGTINRVVAPALALLTVFSVYALNAKAIHASTTLRSALRQQPKRPAESLTYFKQALSYDSFGGQEIQEELAQAALQVIQNPSIDIQLKKEYHDFIVGELHKQLGRTPNDARYYLILGLFLNGARNADEAIVVLNKALALSPKQPTVLLELGVAYMNKNQYDKAVDVMKRACELDPKFDEVRILYTIAAVYTKQFELADELMTPLAGSPKAYDQRLIQAYAQVGNTVHLNADETIMVLNKALALSPKQPTVLLELGVAYMNKNQYDKAVDIMKRAYELDPKFDEVRILYTVAAVYTKQFELADELMTPLAGSPKAYDQRLIQAYAQVGQRDKVIELKADEAIVALNKALALSPKQPTVLLELGAAYIIKNQFDKALDVMKRAYDLDTNFDEARILYAVSAVVNKQFELAEELMTPLAGSPKAYDKRLIQAYAQAGQRDKVVELLEKRNVANRTKNIPR